MTGLTLLADGMSEVRLKHKNGCVIKMSVAGDVVITANSKVDVTIDLASLTTGNEGRDNHLRSADFFDVEHYPTATFHSSKVEQRGEDRLRVIGDLTIRGVTKPVTLDVTVEGKFKDMQGKDRYGFTATTSFSRKEFGLEWNVALESGGWLVSDKITIAIDAQVIAPVAEPVVTR